MEPQRHSVYRSTHERGTLRTFEFRMMCTDELASFNVNDGKGMLSIKPNCFGADAALLPTFEKRVNARGFETFRDHTIMNLHSLKVRTSRPLYNRNQITNLILTQGPHHITLSETSLGRRIHALFSPHSVLSHERMV